MLSSISRKKSDRSKACQGGISTSTSRYDKALVFGFKRPPAGVPNLQLWDMKMCGNLDGDWLEKAVARGMCRSWTRLDMCPSDDDQVPFTLVAHWSDVKCRILRWKSSAFLVTGVRNSQVLVLFSRIVFMLVPFFPLRFSRRVPFSEWWILGTPMTYAMNAFIEVAAELFDGCTKRCVKATTLRAFKHVIASPIFITFPAGQLSGAQEQAPDRMRCSGPVFNTGPSGSRPRCVSCD